MQRKGMFERSCGGFRSALSGSVATWFALASATLLCFAGVGLDIGRGVNQKQQIQGAADAAALAGVSVFTDITQSSNAQAVSDNFINTFASTSGIVFSSIKSTPSVVKNQNGDITAYVMTVKTVSSIDNSLMKMASSSNTVTVQAVAQSAAYKAVISLNNWSSNAVDTNSISWYTVPPDNSIPAVTSLLFSNASGAPKSTGTVTIPVTGTQKIGFLLTNVTDGNATVQTCTVFIIFKNCTQSNDYGSNQYGGASKSVHLFYSHLTPPSKLAYLAVAQNCSLQVFVGATATPTTGCTSSLPANSTFSCSQTSGLTLAFYWNDMGGSTDDKDYNDAVYTVTCSKVDNTIASGVVLTN